MTSRLKLLLRRFLKGESGAFAIIFTLAVIPMFLAMGVAVDGARLYILKSQLQAIADSATISAGDFLSFPKDWPHAVTTHQKSLGLSGYMCSPTPWPDATVSKTQ